MAFQMLAPALQPADSTLTTVWLLCHGDIYSEEESKGDEQLNDSLSAAGSFFR